MAEFDIPEGMDPESEQFKLWLRGGRGGRGVAGPGIGPGGGFTSAFGGGSFAGQGGLGYEGGLSPREKMIKRLMAASQQQPASYESGGPVMGGPPGTDTVPAYVDNGEGVFNKVAMTTPGMGKFMAVLNALAALELGPDDASSAPSMEPPMDDGGMGLKDPGMLPEDDVEGYFLGGLIDKVPVVGKPLHKAASIAAPLALQAVGVPLPIGAALTNFAMEGSTDDLGGSLKNAAMAGGKAYVGGKMSDMASARELEAANKAHLDNLPLPEADPDLSLIGETKPRGYAYGGYTGRPVRPGAQPGVPAGGGYGRPNLGRPPAPAPAPAREFLGNGMPVKPGPQGFGSDENAWLQKQAAAAGIYDPNGNRAALGAAQQAMTQRGQAREAGDVNSLMAGGMGDPSLYTAMLMQNRHERGLQEGSDLADMRAGFAKDAGDFAHGRYTSDSDNAWKAYMAQIEFDRAKILKKTKGK